MSSYESTTLLKWHRIRAHIHAFGQGETILKRLIYGSGAFALVTAAYLFGSTSQAGVFAQTAPATPAAEQSTDGAANEQAESTALAPQAKIASAQAQAAALTKVPGATVKSTDLGSENGTLTCDPRVTVLPAFIENELELYADASAGCLRDLPMRLLSCLSVNWVTIKGSTCCSRPMPAWSPLRRWC